LITALGSSGGQILVRDWHETAGSNLGIALDDSVEVSAFTAETINGDNNNNALSAYNLRDTDPTKNITAIEATVINGMDGNDTIMGMADSRDTLSGGDGKNIISSGFTSDSALNQLRNGLGEIEKDTISGGADQDFIFASVNGSVAHGDDGDDVLMGNAYATFNINPQGAYGGQSAHGAITLDQIYADILAHMDFSFVIETEKPVISINYTKGFTNQYQEFTGAGSGEKFIARVIDNPVTVDNGSLKHSTSGRYEFAANITIDMFDAKLAA